MKQRHRIFIAVNFPADIKEKISELRLRWPDLPASWVKAENLHITLAFLGYVGNEELLEICRISKEVVSRHKSFSIRLKKILYGPPARNASPASNASRSDAGWHSDAGGPGKITPRMVWVEGEKNKELTLLKNDLENAILGSGKVNFSSENRVFSPHITLARIKQWEFKRINPEEVPQIEEDIDLSFPVDSIEVMESVLKRSGPEYEILDSYNLGNI